MKGMLIGLLVAGGFALMWVMAKWFVKHDDTMDGTWRGMPRGRS